MPNQVFCGCGGHFIMTEPGIYVLEWARFFPYKLWAADLLECQACQNKVMRANPKPYREHFNPDFREQVMAQANVDKLVHVDMRCPEMWEEWKEGG